MGSISVACYRPRPDCEEALLELVRNHLPLLRDQHNNPAVVDLWQRFEAVCWYETPSNLPEFRNMFSHFEPI
jgi:hypothetical protein